MSKRIDKSYIAPQLSIREKMVAGVFTLLDLLFLLFGIGTSVLVWNLFSPTYPREAKLINGMFLIAWLLTFSIPIALLVAWIVRT